MPIPIPDPKRALKLEVSTTMLASLDRIAAEHYEAHRDAYEAARAPKPGAADVAAALLEDAVAKELRPSRPKRNGHKE